MLKEKINAHKSSYKCKIKSNSQYGTRLKYNMLNVSAEKIKVKKD